jgi:hypothetical protein
MPSGMPQFARSFWVAQRFSAAMPGWFVSGHAFRRAETTPKYLSFRGASAPRNLLLVPVKRTLPKDRQHHHQKAKCRDHCDCRKRPSQDHMLNERGRLIRRGERLFA